MKAIQVKEPGKVQLVDVSEPEIETSVDVKIRMKAMGICGSDMHILHGENPFVTYPRVIGHEIAGEVIEMGNDVTSLTMGDRVVIEPMNSCGECYACRQNRPNVCEQVEVYGVHQDGGGCETMVVPAHLVHKVRNTLDWDEIALIEPFTIGAQAAFRGDIQRGDDVFIIGAGPIGLCCLKIAKLKGANVAISDFNSERLSFAKEWGADHVIDVNVSSVPNEIQQWTNGKGANVVIDAVGTPSTVEDAISVTSVAARVVLLGFDAHLSSFAQVEVTKKELTICGSRLQTHRFREVVEIFNSPQFDASALISHTFSLNDVTHAFELVGKSLPDVRKVIITI